MPENVDVLYWRYLYGASWIRCTPYVIGVFTGFFLHKMKGKSIKMNWVSNESKILHLELFLQIMFPQYCFMHSAIRNCPLVLSVCRRLGMRIWPLALFARRSLVAVIAGYLLQFFANWMGNGVKLGGYCLRTRLWRCIMVKIVRRIRYGF